MLIEQMIQHFLESQSDRLSANTQRAYSYDLNMLARSFPDLPVEEITPQHLIAFLNAASDLAPSTLARRQAALRACFRWAYQNQWLPADPTQSLESVKVPDRTPTPLSDAQVEAILAAIPATDARNRLLFTLLIETGMRIGEALQLHTHEIQLESDHREEATYRIVTGKNGKERTISLADAPRTVALLQEILMPNQSGLLFRGDPRKGGRPDDPLDYTTVLYHFEQYLTIARAGSPQLFALESQPITIHRLRDTYAAQKIREGTSLSAMRKLLGHKNLETTMRYADAALSDLSRQQADESRQRMPAPRLLNSRHRRPTIGVLIGWRLSWTPNPNGYLKPLFRGITAAITDRDCNLLLACGMNPRTELSDPTRPAWPTLAPDVDFVPVGAWNTDGLIVVNPLSDPSRSRDIHDLMQSGHPVVFIGDGEGDPAIVADNDGGILQALSHFIDKHGHQRIAYIAGSMFDAEGDSGARLRAYYAGLQHFGMEIDPNLIAYGSHTTEGGYAAMKQILAVSEPFTAVLASNDESAMGAMQALREAGMRIPQDVAIIGFDDRREAAAQVPPLTTVHVPLYKSGYQAVDLLLQHIYGDPNTEQSVKIGTSLALRQSCGCRQDGDITSLISKPNQPDLAAPAAAEVHHASIVESIAQAVLAETQRFYDIDEIRALCDRLVNGFILSIQKSDPLDFQEMVEELLAQAESADEDAHIWQSVISSLRLGVPVLIEADQDPSAHQFALDMLDQARNTISERMRRQHGRYIIDQKWMSNRIGHLTTRLLMTSDEAQILDVLAIDLPAMGINRTSLSFFEPDGDDLVGWSTLHTIPSISASSLRYPTRQFPPQALYPADLPFALIVVPLVTPAGQVGFIAYDPTDIELAGPITQQIAAALNSARLYVQATEGRKLAEEANNLKSRFLSMVSHELRTPLNLINGLSEMILQAEPGVHEAPLPNHYRKDIEQIHSSAQHLGRLIRDVLDLASSEVGQLRLENELVDLCDTFEMVTATGRQMAKDKGLSWQATLPPDRMWVWGDRTRLRQVALNLVSNAVKFTSRGEVSLSVEIEAGNAVISVTDTGLGISEDDQAVIFDEFRRSDQALARGYGGLGLGLAISKRLVGMHGGEIGVHSTGLEGGGSTFFFTLPLIEPELIHTDDQPLPIGVDARILLLSDGSGSSDRLHAHLQESGYAVTQVHINGSDDWFKHILRELPGAVIFDTGIAPTHSWDVLKMLKDDPATRSIPLLFYSMSADHGAMLELDYLAKPVGVADLSRALESHRHATDYGIGDKVVLIVDDDPATLEMHMRIVQSRLGQNHTVMTARNGREALKLMQQRTPNLVLLDLMMPELDGFGVLEAMREGKATRDIPVIVLTGQMLTETEMARLNRGVATVLGKGLFSLDETLGHIDAALARKHKLGSEAQRLVRRAMAYIHEHYDEAISREDLSRHLGMSSDYLTLCFRREVGMTFVAYLNRYRVNQAKTMLAQNDRTITEVAMAAGFLDSAYFSRVFRRHEGVSPEVYRRTVRAATP